MGGKAMANYPYELAQDAAYQSHTGRLTGLWFLPKLAQGLNTNNNNNNLDDSQFFQTDISRKLIIFQVIYSSHEDKYEVSGVLECDAL
jgi:hypothetical protein